MAKEPKPRQNKKAPDRQTAVPARWSVALETPQYVYLNRQDFQTKDGTWDKAAQYAAQQKYPGKDLIYQDNGGKQLYLPRAKFQNVETRGLSDVGRTRYAELPIKGKFVNFYDPQANDPTEKRYGETHKATSLLNVDPDKVKKVHTEASTLKAQRAAEAERLDRRLKGEFEAKRALVEIGISDRRGRFERAEAKAIARRIAAREKTPKKVVKRKSLHVPHGGIVRRGKVLGKNQIVAKSGRAWYVAPARIAQRAEARKNRVAEIKRRNKIRAAQDRAKAKAKIREQKKVIARRKAHTKAFFAAKPQLRARQVAAKAVSYAKQLRNLPGFGKTPVKMLLQQNGMSRDAPGKRAVMSAMTHAEKYPARKLGGKAPFSASAKGLQTLADVTRPYMNSVSELVSGQTLRPSVAGGSMFATANTLTTARFPEGGAGIFFRIDADQVIANLTQKYPAALRMAAIEAADRIGRKMLDIVEPYVPKDTGLLYTSGETNVQQTAAGLVDMTGGEAYPSGQMFGVSISYNAPYAEIVYFDEQAAHGKAYNDKHGTSEKGEKETARWIEAAFEHEKGALQGLLFEYSRAITLAIGTAGGRTFTRASGKQVTIFPK